MPKKYNPNPFFLLLWTVFFLLLTAIPGFCGRFSLVVIFPINPCISTCQELQEMQNDLTKDYCLAKDIECKMTNPNSTGNADPQLDFNPFGIWGDEKGFKPVGNDTTRFTGNFDGRGYKVKNLYINRPSDDYVGLFGYISGSEIKDVGLKDVDIKGEKYTAGLGGKASDVIIANCHSAGSVSANDFATGGLIGQVDGNTTTVANCHSAGSVSSNDCYVGGLIGQVWGINEITDCYSAASVKSEGNNAHSVGGLIGHITGTTITDSYSTGKVEAACNVGGLVGGIFDFLGGVTITNSYSTGNVFATLDTYSFAGGLVGSSVGAIISDCYSTGDIEASGDYCGGLIGRIFSSSTIQRCYSAGAVSGGGAASYLSGLIGYKDSGSILNSYWDKTTSGRDTSDGGTGKTTAEMRQQATYTGWDFTNIWQISGGVTYPCLNWQANSCPLPSVNVIYIPGNNISVGPDAIVTVPLKVYNAADVGAVGIKISFNPSVVNITNATQGDFDAWFAFDDSHASESASEGWVTINTFKMGSPGLSGEVLVANVTLKAVGNEDDKSPLDIEVLTIINPDGDELSHKVVNGTFAIE